MSTSALYDSTRTALRQQLPSVIDSQLDSLGLAIVTTFDFRTYAVAEGSVAGVLREAFRQFVEVNSQVR